METICERAIIINAGGSVALHITTSPSTPPGTYQIQVEGTGSTTIHRTQFTLVVVPAPTVNVSSGAFVNTRPGADGGWVSWTT